MEKTILIDDKQVRFKATAAMPKRYKAQFQRDYFSDLLRVAKVFGGRSIGKNAVENVSFDALRHLDMDVLYDIIWTMAKSADGSIPDPITWLDGFDTFPLMDILPQVQELLENSMPHSKKK